MFQYLNLNIGIWKLQLYIYRFFIKFNLWWNLMEWLNLDSGPAHTINTSSVNPNHNARLFNCFVVVLLEICFKKTHTAINITYYRVCSITILDQFSFYCVSSFWSILHPGSVEWAQNKECYFRFSYISWLFLLLLFFIITFVSLSFSFTFLIKYQINATEYQPVRNTNWW